MEGSCSTGQSPQWAVVPVEEEGGEGGGGEEEEAQYTILIISRSVLLKMKNVSVKSCRETKNTFYVQ
jgi:hypothetical protein